MSSLDEKKSREKRGSIKWLLLLLLLLLLGFGIWFLFFNSTEDSTAINLEKNSVIDSAFILDSLAKIEIADSLENLARQDSLEADSVNRIRDSLEDLQNKKKRTSKDVKITISKLDTSSNAISDDTLLDIEEDSTTDEIDLCVKDTIAPWVYPDPTGGLYEKAQSVKLICDDPAATVEWKIEGESDWRRYTGRVISVEKNLTISYRAVDSCNNRLDKRSKSYEIKRSSDEKKCSDDMAFIKVGGEKFCIDKYEWPNKKRKTPSSNVSFYEAQDSCFSVGKRLCTTSEWSLACAGAYSWKYAYGVKYEKQACVTRTNKVARSGSKPECRGYFEVFDMSGNLAEWTNTHSKKNSDFYNVMGGFWQSGSQTTCYKPRYSYYPQNRHNPVGFRCCKDIE